MARNKLYERRIEMRYPESMIVELETLAAVQGKSVSEVIRYIVADWMLRNQAEVQLAKQKLADKRGVLNMKKVDSEKWLTHKLLS